MRLWVDHLEDLARAARLYETFFRAINSSPGNNSDLEYVVPDVDVTFEGEPTKMRLIYEDDIVWLVDGDE